MIISMLKKSAYGKTAVYSVSAKIIFVLSAMGILWLLARMLPKDVFGLFLLAQTVVMIFGGICASAFQNLILYRVSRKPGDAGSDDQIFNSRFSSTLLIFGGIFSCAVSLTLLLAAPYLSQWFDKPGWEYWLTWLSFLIPLEVSRTILVFWHRANFNVFRGTVFLDAAPNFFRLLFLLLAFLAEAGNISIVAAYYVSAFVCFALLLIRSGLGFDFSPNIVSRWDIKYGLKVAATLMISQPGRSLDVLLVGFFLAAEILAEYTLAARLAILLMIGKSAFLPLLSPRMGKHLEEQRVSDVKQEFLAARFLATIFTTLGVAFLMIFGPHILAVFGDYQDAFPVLIGLGGLMLVRSFGGADGELLNMAGLAGWKLIVNIVSIAIMLSLSVALIDTFGVSGVVIAYLLTELLTRLQMLLIIEYHHRLRLNGLADVLYLVISLVAIMTVFLSQDYFLLVACALIIASGFYVFTGRRLAMVRGFFKSV